MNSRDLSNLMWGEALSLLEQADRLHRQFFRPAATAVPAWEPPADVIETADTVAVHVALPGAAADSILVQFEPGAIVVSARRPFPLEGSDGRARVHALEIPHGRFQRRIGLPTQSLALIGRTLQDGCLTLTFSKNKKEST
ncbi:MAG TPA: Hsp20/alpha crystallin family protein [Burkholderiales bacterium]|nr:Hsp20/alpha crystallin family protein [Burkholderiales bacterium]